LLRASVSTEAGEGKDTPTSKWKSCALPVVSCHLFRGWIGV